MRELVIPPQSLRSLASKASGVVLLAFGILLAGLHLGSPLLSLCGFLTAFGIFTAVRSNWLACIPTAIVAGHSYPFTGSLLVSLGDLFVVAAVASVLFRCQLPKLDYRLQAILLLMLGVASVGAVCGWFALPDGLWNDQLSLYLTKWSSLYVLKGYLLGTLLGMALLMEWQESPTTAWKRLVCGLQLSAFVVASLVLAERSVAFGVFDFENTFRASGPCFSMHIGGQHIDAYWGLVLPVLLFANRLHTTSRSSWRAALVIIVQLISIYAIFVTMSRLLIALSASLIGFATVVHAKRLLRVRSPRLLSMACGVGLMSLLAVMWSSGGAVRQRFVASRHDLDTRIAHAKDISLIATKVNPLVGNGLGTYRQAYRKHRGLSPFVLKLDPASESLGARSVNIQPASSVYLEQFVNVHRPSPWTVRIRYSVSSPTYHKTAPLTIMMCEKTLLQSFQCVQPTAMPPRVLASAGDHQTHEMTSELDVAQIASLRNTRLLPRPTTLAIVASGECPVIMHEIDVKDANGNDVLWNGSFREGSSYWFFTGDDHLLWHSKNAWSNVLVELGWVGLLTWLGTLAFFGWRVLHRSWTIGQLAHAETDAWECEKARASTGLAVLAAWLPMSFFGTLVDTPWIMQLLTILLTAVAVKPTAVAADPYAIPLAAETSHE